MQASFVRMLSQKTEKKRHEKPDYIAQKNQHYAIAPARLILIY